jgi:putative transposase
VRFGVHRIKRLRKKLGLRCRQKRKFKAKTNSKHDLPAAPTLLNQDFTATSPNQAWCGDITYIATDEGWLYLAGLKDLFSGELFGIHERAHDEASGNAGAVPYGCIAAPGARPDPSHGPRAQYCAHAYQDLVGQFRTQASMSRRGNCFDNAPIESFWGT